MSNKAAKYLRDISMVRSRAPLRLSFGGGGTDVSPYSDEHGGCVISATISLAVYATLQPSKSHEIKIRSLDYDSVVHYANSEKDFEYDGQMDLAKGVFRQFGAHKFEKTGFDIYAHGDAPPGSGLGSSSTFTVSLIGLFREWQSLALTPHDIADMAYDIERVDIGIKGGKQDQYAAAYGGFNFIEFNKEETIVTPLRLSPFTIHELEYNLLLCYTGGVRESQKLIKQQIENFENKNKKAVEALHEIKSLAQEVRKALVDGNLNRFGELLHEGWLQKKRTAAGITNDRIDELYDVALKAGAIGGKIAGAGGGGYLMIYTPFHKKHKVTEKLTEMGGQVISFRFDPCGLQTWRVYNP